MARARTSKDTFFEAGSGPRTIEAGSGWVLGLVATAAAADRFYLYDGEAALFAVSLAAGASLAVQFVEPLRFEAGLSCDPRDCDVLLTVMGRERV